MASPCRLRPTASGPRRCRRLGPALGLQQPHPAQPPATPPSPPADAVALSKRNRPAGDPSRRGPARIPAWLRREILDRSPGVPPHSPVLRTREMPSARPHPGGSFIPLRGSASPPETCGSGPASKAVPGQARHSPCLRRSGRGLRRLGGWTPPAASSWPAARRPALYGRHRACTALGRWGGLPERSRPGPAVAPGLRWTLRPSGPPERRAGLGPLSRPTDPTDCDPDDDPHPVLSLAPHSFEHSSQSLDATSLETPLPRARLPYVVRPLRGETSATTRDNI